MSKVLELARKLGREEEGAALIEYTILIGIIAVAVITSVGLVGTWMTGRWTSLTAALGLS